MSTGTYSIDRSSGEMRKSFVHRAAASPTTTGLGLGCAGVLALAFAGGVHASQGPTKAAVSADGKSFVISISKLEGASQAADKDAAGDGPVWAQDLEWLKFHTDASISKLAELFGVTRKAFYAWMNGDSEPRAGRIERIAVFREALSSLATREERSAAMKLLNRPLSDGSTIQSILSLSLAEQDLLARLRNGFSELEENIQQGASRARSAGSRSRAFESEFPSA